VGILTGPAAVGHIGSSDRMKYATVGNTVNTAARLETHDKLGFEEEDSTCRILIGQATLDCLGEGFETRCIGDHVLKGRGAAVTIHRVYGFARRDG
jgi:adenylate cyclase